MIKLLKFLFLMPKNIAESQFQHFQCFQPLQALAPLLVRIVVGYVFMMTGWGKLNHLALMIDNFREWGIPFPEIMTPFVAGFEFFGGIFLMLGLLTRISAGGLAVVMLVAIQAVKWVDVDSFFTLLGFEETLYFAIFTWLAVAGAGRISLDYYIEKKLK